MSLIPLKYTLSLRGDYMIDTTVSYADTVQWLKEVYEQQVFLVWIYHLHNSTQQQVILFSTNCTEYFGEVLGICGAYVVAVYLWSHTHIITHIHTGVPGLQCCGPPVFISLNTWRTSTVLRSHQSPLPPTKPKPVIPHLSSCPRQCAVGALVVQINQRGSNSSMLQEWMRKGDCDGHGLFIDGVWSEQGRGEKGGRGGRRLRGGNVVGK